MEAYVCGKCGQSYSSKEYKESRFCRNCGSFLFSRKRDRSSFTSRKGDPTHAEMIAEAIKELREPFTTRQIINIVLQKFSVIRPINPDSLGTDIAGCCANLKSHYSLPDLPILLVSVGRGLYRRYDPKKDKDLPSRVDMPDTALKVDEMTKVEESGLVHDIEKAQKIGRILYELFRTRSGFFKKYEMPEYVLPETVKEGSVEHACYLTYIVSIDYQTDAVKLWQKARHTYIGHQSISIQEF